MSSWWGTGTRPNWSDRPQMLEMSVFLMYHDATVEDSIRDLLNIKNRKGRLPIVKQ